MAAARNIDNVKYFAPIAISRLYEKQAQFFHNINDSKQVTCNFTMNQRRVQSEKQFEKMQKMMFAKSKDGNYTAPTTAALQAKQTQAQQTQTKQEELQ